MVSSLIIIGLGIIGYFAITKNGFNGNSSLLQNNFENAISIENYSNDVSEAINKQQSEIINTESQLALKSPVAPEFDYNRLSRAEKRSGSHLIDYNNSVDEFNYKKSLFSDLLSRQNLRLNELIGKKESLNVNEALMV